MTKRVVGLAMIMVVLGCSPETSTDGTDNEERVSIVFEGDGAEQLLRFYFGSFIGPKGGDPVAAGILEKREKSWYLRNPENVDGASPLLAGLFTESKAAGELSEEALGRFVQLNYYSVRAFPATLEEAKLQIGAWSEPEWFNIDVKGSIVPLRRSTWVRRTDIESALDRMQTLEDPILYDSGTVFIGEHLQGSDIVETTLMRKRNDGFWDFWAYDADGVLTDVIKKEPRDMLVPTRCTGCHYGDRLFEPERSYPGEARPGPAGDRALYIPDSWRQHGWTTSIEEHAKRSDTVLGLYVTLYLAEAAAEAASGGIASPVLERFGIDSASQ